MVVIAWKDEFCTGNPAVDHEHQQLIHGINSVCEGIHDGPPDDETRDRLGDLLAHITAHFALEEALMREQLYDEYQPHKDDHEVLLDHIRDIMCAYEAGVFAGRREDFIKRLGDWFGGHFGTLDARLHRVLGQAPDPVAMKISKIDLDQGKNEINVLLTTHGK